MDKFIKTLDDVSLVEKINGGSCSDIFMISGNYCFKYFNEDYRDLTDPINIEFLNTIKTISDISSLPYVIRGEDIYRSESELFGYSMPFVKAVVLDDVSDMILAKDLFLGFEKLAPSLRILAEHFVKPEDLGGDNIMFNGDMYLLDLDLSLIDKNSSPDELYMSMREKLFKALFKRMSGRYFSFGVKDDRFKELEDGLLYFVSEQTGIVNVTLGDFKTEMNKVYKKDY